MKNRILLPLLVAIAAVSCKKDELLNIDYPQV
jgi:hypothetical protein